MTLSKTVIALTVLMALGGLAAVGVAWHAMQPLHGDRFAVLFVLAVVTARLKVKLPRLTGNMAVNLPFLLIAVSELSMLEALLVALPACAVQCFPKEGGNLNAVQTIFNLGTTGVAVAAASLIGTHLALLAAGVFFLAQTVPVASIIRFTEGGAIHRIWADIAHYSFPFYVLSAGITAIATSSTHFGWQVPLVCSPVLYAVYRSYESYFRGPSVARE